MLVAAKCSFAITSSATYATCAYANATTVTLNACARAESVVPGAVARVAKASHASQPSPPLNAHAYVMGSTQRSAAAGSRFATW